MLHMIFHICDTYWKSR